ncbi:hypothetical protein JYT71_00530 [Acidimicrobiaceae bacterium AH-315-P05]|nr:hypothetical protein [Acidimicrobiaceae bacterium AH-315-P05]
MAVGDWLVDALAALATRAVRVHNHNLAIPMTVIVVLETGDDFVGQNDIVNASLRWWTY